jgi:hypothetical protein
MATGRGIKVVGSLCPTLCGFPGSGESEDPPPGRTVALAGLQSAPSLAATAARRLKTGWAPDRIRAVIRCRAIPRPSATYVHPHQQTNPNTTQRDNYGATGDVNPYTGAVGTRAPKY